MRSTRLEAAQMASEAMPTVEASADDCMDLHITGQGVRLEGPDRAQAESTGGAAQAHSRRGV